ncbi:MAG: hypothetical protein JW703_00415 [Candidatus Diapherotrites archaeon]|nr:hypothetical protein [Candidatus Diapherotrites archaeon]
MGKKFVLIFFLLLSLSVFAQETELVFSDLGYSGIVFDSLNESKCIEMDFMSDVNSFQLIPVFSLHFDFFGQKNNTSFASVYLNDSLINEFSSFELANISGSDTSVNGWKRIYVPSDAIKKSNKLKICAKTSNSSPKIEFFSDSFFGWYSAPAIEREKSFEMNLLDEAVAGKDLTVLITLKNYGAVEQKVSVIYRKSELENRTPWVKFVSGKSTFSGTVPPCSEWNSFGCVKPGEATFSYLIRIGKVGKLSLLPAILEYENFFGDKISGIESNRLYLDVVAPKVELAPILVVPDSTHFIDSEIPIKLIVKNIGVVDAPSINLSLFSSPELSVSATSFESFELKAAESKEFDLILLSSVEGIHSIECNALIPDYLLSFNCEKTMIAFENPGVPLELIASAVLAIIGIIVLIYFYFKKSMI